MTQPAQFMSNVEHIMTAAGHVVSSEDSISTARAAIEANDGKPVPVVNADYSLKGVVTGDALLMDGPATAGQLAVAPRMTVASHESAFSVVSRMLRRNVEWVAVIKDGKLVGTVSRDCVMSAFGEMRGA